MNNNSSKQVLLSVIGVAILVVAVVGVSFAFFSYVNVGTNVNSVDTGTIIFDSEDAALTLTNVFPETAATSDNVGSVKVSGSTTYGAGIEFVVKASNIANADTTGKIIPTITVAASASKPEAVTLSYVYSGDGLPADGIIARGSIAGGEDVTGVETLTEILTVTAFYDRTKYHITDQDYDTIAPIRPSYVTEDTMLVPTETWNNLTNGANGAYSFTLDVLATQGGADRLPAAD